MLRNLLSGLGKFKIIKTYCVYAHNFVFLSHTKQKKIYVVTTLKRPVPLRHYVYTGNSKQTSKEIFEIVRNNEIDQYR